MNYILLKKVLKYSWRIELLIIYLLFLLWFNELFCCQKVQLYSLQKLLIVYIMIKKTYNILHKIIKLEIKYLTDIKDNLLILLISIIS